MEDEAIVFDPLPSIGFAHGADGRMEWAADRSAAIEGCPYLGRLAIEAPEQVDSLLALQAIGADFMKQFEQPAPVVSDTERAPKPEKLNPKVSESQPRDIPQHQSEVTSAAWQTEAAIRASVQPADTIEAVDLSQPEPGESVLTSKPPIEGVPKAVARQTKEQPDLHAEPASPIGTVEATMGSMSIDPIPEEPPAATRAHIDSLSDDAAETGTPTVFLADTEPGPSAHTEIASTEYDEAPDLALEQADLPVQTELDLGVSPEIAAVYSALQVLSAEAVSTESNQTAAMEGTQLLIDETIEAPALSAFQVLVAELAPSAELPTLASIQESAADQPLAQTIMQLAEFLTESEQAPPPQLRVALEQITSSSEAIPAAETPLTPELTAQLIGLLRLVGYHNPHETLLNFARMYGVEYVCQLTTYLGVLRDAYARREFQTLQTTVLTLDDTKLRLGKILSSLILRQPTSAAA